MKSNQTILMADDHPVFRKGLRQVISEVKGFTVTVEAEDGEEALAALEGSVPDILILDVDMPKKSGIDVARIVQRRSLDTKVIVLTMHKDEFVFNKAMDAGIHGYVLKENAVNEIITALHAVAEGKYFISPSIADYLVRRSGYKATTATKSSVTNLTPAERRVLVMISEHKTSKEIAAELGISPKTVDRHRENIGKKLELHGPHALLKFAEEHKTEL